MADAFARVAASGFAEIALIACGDAAPASARLLDRAYRRLDAWVFAKRDDAGELLDLAEALPHRKDLTLAQHRAFAALELDVAFALGEFDDAILDGVACCGVWRFGFGEDLRAPEALAGVREVAEGGPLSGSGLRVRLAAGSAERVAYRSWARTYPYSIARNRAQLLRKTAEFPVRALGELHRRGRDWLEQCRPLPGIRGQSPNSEPGGDDGRIRALTPNSPLPILRRIVHRGVEKALSVEQWFLAFRFREGRLGDARAVGHDLRGYTRLMPPKDRYWADPFALEKGGRHYIFFEELPFKAGKAHISVLEVSRSGDASTPVPVLERDYHLSYPFILEHEGELYMIPESAQNGTVELWRCTEFPHRWKLDRVLLDGVRLVDATIHRGPDRWWMFANAAAEGSSVFDDELHLFHAERLTGEWRPHPRNPVRSDARAARPAGALYWRGGALYRPAQICAPLYGSGLAVHRVLRLTAHEYAERQVERVVPVRGGSVLGLHTVNRAGDLTVVDAFTKVPRL